MAISRLQRCPASLFWQHAAGPRMQDSSSIQQLLKLLHVLMLFQAAMNTALHAAWLPLSDICTVHISCVAVLDDSVPNQS